MRDKWGYELSTWQGDGRVFAPHYTPGVQINTAVHIALDMVLCLGLAVDILQDVIDYGRFEITLEDYLKRNKISKNSLVESANLQRTQLNAYCNNKIRRPDFDVLARICYALDCELADIVRYVKPENIHGGEVNG